MASDQEQEPLWIKTAWASDGRSLPWLVSAYDEMTFDEWGQEPDFYTDALKANDGCDIRTLVLTIPLDAVLDLFRSPSIEATPAASQGDG